ncbi:MAG: DUF2088 domain-containing protein [Proteobacteria bacterium]|nr:DUF2088 domain-containing protein [Pseudomonadota bacterium]MBU2629697.1 DUF2088 domain-containing protein [Pseudomonadota bacterium]
MLKKIEFKYGKTIYPFELPETAEILKIQEPAFSIDKKKFAADFLAALPKQLPDDAGIAIVVADKTRLCGYKTYLPWLLDVLHKKGMENRQIQFFIAYGTHARQSDEDCFHAYGNVYRNYEFIHHDSTDKSCFTYRGKTPAGTRIHLRKDILEKDLIITFGALSHHYFAGYGGGRKLLFPGLGYQPDIYQNHELFLDKNLKSLALGCQPGSLENNPLAQDLKHIDDGLETQRVAIHGIMDSKGKVCRLLVNNTYNEFLSACKTLDFFYKEGVKKQYELVVASCGGFPKDINFIQAHKAINNAAMLVKNNGSLVVFAECRDGIGSDTFLEYFKYNFTQAFDVLEKDYLGNGGTALSMMTKTDRIKIFLKTELDDKICTAMGVKKITIDKIIKFIKEFEQDMACSENSSLLIR